ncbi:hypothetical protein [Deinococcus roseus]|uniref:Uncharacterized protein n=1 Tax=Deinococcus roseus TaxID=392414 RepID=A0ABQ2CVU5_9DEIO|nr:hypothetical protein [Deinococcus roseus]GGJ25876.1 hypothetical protein GCM10008938_09990 [Deinococcus roseus]
MHTPDARASLEHIFALLRDPDYDLFKHGQLNEALENLQRLTHQEEGVQDLRHLTYAEMKGHRQELLERLSRVPDLLEQQNLQEAVRTIRGAVRMLQAP